MRKCLQSEVCKISPLHGLILLIYLYPFKILVGRINSANSSMRMNRSTAYGDAPFSHFFSFQTQAMNDHNVINKRAMFCKMATLV